MKFVAAAVACIAGSTAMTLATAELRGMRNLEQDHKKMLRRVPPGFDINQFTQPPEVADDSSGTLVEDDTTPNNAPEVTNPPTAAPVLPDCTPVDGAPSRTEEYVVVQYDSSANDKVINFDKKADQIVLDVLYEFAYKNATGPCTQKGAVNEVFDAEFLAFNEDDSTFLLRIGRITNSIGEMFSGTSESCGPIVYNSTDPGSVDLSVRRLEEQCECPLPTAAQLVAGYSAALANEYKDEGLGENFIVGTQQLCAEEGCKADKKGITTYSSAGVCLGDMEALTNVPSSSPTDFPTDFPTKFPTNKPSRKPTTKPSKSPTEGPTKEPTFEPTPSPSAEGDTPSPTAEDTPSPTAEDTSSPTADDTPSPTADDTPSPTITNTTSSRFLVEEELVVSQNQDAYAYLTEAQAKQDVCSQIDWKLVNNEANRRMCKDYLELPYAKTDAKKCAEQSSETKVPKKFFSVARTSHESLVHTGVSASNPDFERYHFSDSEALEFIEENCGADVAHAYQCLAPPAFRADLFRFCALYSNGGVYLDSDILPLVRLEDLYDPCAVATVGHDWPQGRPQKQMKILAGQKNAPIFGCMLQKIVGNVANEFYSDNALAITGPIALQECYELHSEGVAITYHDTRQAAFPFTGMRDVHGHSVLALETPPTVERENYKTDVDSHEVYRPNCPLHTNIAKKVAATVVDNM